LKIVPEVGDENWKSLFANGREVERRHRKLVGKCDAFVKCAQQVQLWRTFAVEVAGKAV